MSEGWMTFINGTYDMWETIKGDRIPGEYKVLNGTKFGEVFMNSTEEFIVELAVTEYQLVAAAVTADEIKERMASEIAEGVKKKLLEMDAIRIVCRESKPDEEEPFKIYKGFTNIGIFKREQVNR